jgi:hypothetical protein
MITKEGIVDAMRSTLDAYYTQHPTGAMGNVPLSALADAALAAVADVPVSDVAVIPDYNPEMTPALRWNEIIAGYDRAPRGVGVTTYDGKVVLIPYDGDHPNPDQRIPLEPADAQAFAAAVLATTREAYATQTSKEPT